MVSSEHDHCVFFQSQLPDSLEKPAYLVINMANQAKIICSMRSDRPLIRHTLRIFRPLFYAITLNLLDRLRTVVKFLIGEIGQLNIIRIIHCVVRPWDKNRCVWSQIRHPEEERVVSEPLKEINAVICYPGCSSIFLRTGMCCPVNKFAIFQENRILFAPVKLLYIFLRPYGDAFFEELELGKLTVRMSAKTVPFSEMGTCISFFIKPVRKKPHVRVHYLKVIHVAEYAMI